MSPPASARVLLEGVLDYAGTFPPAGLAPTSVVANYARDRASGEAWMLGRLVVPARGLREFERLIESLSQDDRSSWPITVVLGPQPAGSLSEVMALVQGQADQRDAPMGRVASVEFPPLHPAEIRALMRQVPEHVEAFFETPLDADLDRRIHAIADGRAMAKVRTGGLMAGAFPGAAELMRFFNSCADAAVAFKATAGLHHAVRGCYALTYEPGSPTAIMHGFLNVGVAAALVHVGAKPAEAIDALLASTADAFQFGDDGLTWRDRVMTNDDLTAVRRQFFRSFGSCAFREPVEELARLGLL